LLIAAMALALVGGLRAADDHLRASGKDSYPRPALLTQGGAVESAVLPPRVELRLNDRLSTSSGLALSPAGAVAPFGLGGHILSGHAGTDDARQPRLRGAAGSRAPPAE
jgi:hypothetical protein